MSAWRSRPWVSQAFRTGPLFFSDAAYFRLDAARHRTVPLARPAGCATARGSDAAIGRCLERQALPRTAESDVIQAPGISATRPAAGQPAGAAAGAA
eukprot:gene5867-biopygen2801